MPLAPWQADPYRRTSDTEVLACFSMHQGFAVRLSSTIFYPEGGGQPPDHGRIAGVGVCDVQKDADGVIHLVEDRVALGPCRVELDWERRFDHMQQHTYAGHIWRLIDDKTKKPLHYFIVPRKPGKLIYKAR